MCVCFNFLIIIWLYIHYMFIVLYTYIYVYTYSLYQVFIYLICQQSFAKCLILKLSNIFVDCTSIWHTHTHMHACVYMCAQICILEGTHISTYNSISSNVVFIISSLHCRQRRCRRPVWSLVRKSQQLNTSGHTQSHTYTDKHKYR